MTHAGPQRPRPRALRFLALHTAALALAAAAAAYGPFKERTEDFQWQVLKSPHFDVYHYPEEAGLARRAAALAEKALEHNARVLDYYPKARQPFFLFQSHLDFQQTNISPEVIGPGTGGFTEAYKNRMVLPTTQSDKWLEVVITHELAHALQFDLLYGEGTRNFQVFKNYVIPLWVMEGTAEYCARNWDGFADMVLRDAVLHERVPDLDLLDGFSHLDEVYVAYKAGQSAVQYLAETQGEEAVARLLKKYKAQISTGQIIRDITGKSLGAFNKAWKRSLRERYWLQAKGKRPAMSLGRALTTDDSEELNSNDGAAFSPDGRSVAFVSTRRRREEVWVQELEGKQAKPLFSGPFEELGRSGGYGVPGTRLAWSPDGKDLAFVRVRDGAKRLCLGSVQDGKIRELPLPFREVAAPAYAPDGKAIAFSAALDGISQVYKADLGSGQVTQLTHETATSLVTDPSWSPDGKSLAFSVEEGGRNQVFVINAADGQGRLRLSPADKDSLMPAFSADGSKVFFTIEDNGAYNLAWAPAAGGAYERLSDVVTGVFAPKPSADGRWLALTVYEDGCQNIVVIPAPGYQAPAIPEGIQQLIDPYAYGPRGAPPVQGPAALPSAAQDALKNNADPGTGQADPSAFQSAPLSATAAAPGKEPDPVTSQPLASTDTPRGAASQDSTGGEPAPRDAAEGGVIEGVEPYRLSISPDLFVMVFGYDSQSGLVGGGYVSASDMTGDHNLSLVANFMPGYQTVAQADYVFYRGRLDLGFSAFYRNTNFFLTSLNPQTVDSTFVDQDWGASLFGRRPLSKFMRWEASLSSRHLYRQLNGNATLDPEVQATLGDNFINALGTRLLRDTQTYKNYDTYGGYQLSLSASYADKVLGGTRNLVTYQAEARWNLPLSLFSRDTVLNLRLLGLDQSGSDRQVFYFGGAQVRGLAYNEYLGQKLGLANVQLRQPYLKRLNGTLWPFESLLIKDVHMVAFYDVGLAPSQWEQSQPEDWRAGYGGGLRMHCFLFEKAFLLFAFDIGQRTDKPGSTYYYFTLGQIF